MASCIVKGCTGDQTLHPFPRNLDMIKVWLRQTRQNFGDPNAFAQRVLVTSPAGLYHMCSRHFSPECYVTGDGSRKILKEDAVPTIFTLPAPPPPVLKMVKIKKETTPVRVSPSSAPSGVFLSSPQRAPSVRDACIASSSRREEKMLGESILKCFVSGCPNSSEDQPLYPGVILHPFPTDFTWVKLWLQQTGQRFGNLDLYACHVLKNCGSFRMCSSHFSPDSYLTHSSATNLRPDAIPTIFPNSENPVKAEEEETRIGFTEAIDAGEGSDGRVDEKRGVRDVGTSFDPTWGVCSVGTLTRPILVKDAFTTITRPGKIYQPLKLLTATAEKSVQCSPFDFSVDGDNRQARWDHSYQVAPFLPPGETGIRLPSHWSEAGGHNWAAQEDYGPNEGAPVRDGKLFLALEDVLISLMQHLVNSPLIEANAKLTTQRILQQALQIIGKVTGDKWVIAEREEDFENLDEVPVKCGDVGVYFSPDEWDYMESHKDLYMDIIPEDPLLTEAQQDMASDQDLESESEDDDKSSRKSKNSPEWKPNSDRSGPSESEASSEESGQDSDDSEIHKQDEFWKNPDLKIETSEDGKSKIFWCVKCQVPTKDRQSFRSHLKSLRHINYKADQEVVTCEDCGETFPARSALIKHRAENHATKKYACTICGLEYDYISQWVIHQRAHTGEKPFECEKCGKRFGHKCTLLVHRRKHAKGKNVKCAECGEVFDSKFELSKHEQVHKPKKPFQCSVCGKGFGSKRFFKKHMLEHGLRENPERIEEARSDPEEASA